MPTLIKSFDGNKDFNPSISQNIYQTNDGACFTNPSSCTLDSAKFYLKKRTGSPTGNGYAVVYAVSGTVGTNAKPTGSILATSDALDVSTLTTSFALTTFTFSGANRITLSASTGYYVGFFYNSGTADVNDLSMANQNSDGDATINYAETQNGVWTAYSNLEANFYVYKESVAETAVTHNLGLLGVGT